MPAKVNWSVAIRPLLRKYKGKKHPLEYGNLYQLVVMVVISAQSTDNVVNAKGARAFQGISGYVRVGSGRKRGKNCSPICRASATLPIRRTGLLKIAKTVREDAHIPLTLEKLTALPGIGRKSANVILREAGRPPEGIIVDLHVMRVAPRLGIANGKDPREMEAQLMEELPKKEWDAGMAMSFLGREICRPKPDCAHCLMNPVCAYYQSH